ncbi:MAG: hypothetical protein M1396_06410 [Chloroflexi bacterium]|nr:hypothetical protein [Chloroflexota bacterium]
MLSSVTCPQCGQRVAVRGEPEQLECLACDHLLSKWYRFNALLDQWYETKKWRKDIIRPDPMHVLEMLWTANGMGERIYQATSPKSTPYSIFVFTVTRAIARGIDDGWVEIIEPLYPLAADPVYRLKFTDPDRLPDEIAKLYPEVNMDEEIVAPADSLGEELAGVQPLVTPDSDGPVH